MSICLFICGENVFASDPGLSLPLNGYYRCGKYMPVEFPSTDSELRLSADGAVTTLVSHPGGGIVPWLILKPIASVAQLPLHELQPDEKVVGFATKAPDIAAKLFPGDKIISIDLDAAHPLPGAPAAWQTLDAVVLDTISAFELSDAAKKSLLAGGTTLVATGDAKQAPDKTWPWKWQDNYWVLAAPPALAPLPSDTAYDPAAAWQPGRSSRYRRGIIIIAVVLVAGFATARSLPKFWGPPVLGVFVLVGIAGMKIWDAVQTPIATAVGIVHIAGTPAGIDTWIYQRAEKDSPVGAGFVDLAFPVLPASDGPADLTLVCKSDGTPIQFTYTLVRDHPMAFVFQTMSMEPTPDEITSDTDSPLRLLQSLMYPNTSVIGQGPPGMFRAAGVVQWPSLLLARSEPIPKNASGASGLDSSNK